MSMDSVVVLHLGELVPIPHLVPVTQSSTSQYTLHRLLTPMTSHQVAVSSLVVVHREVGLALTVLLVTLVPRLAVVIDQS